MGEGGVSERVGGEEGGGRDAPRSEADADQDAADADKVPHLELDGRAERAPPAEPPLLLRPPLVPLVPLLALRRPAQLLVARQRRRQRRALALALGAAAAQVEARRRLARERRVLVARVVRRRRRRGRGRVGRPGGRGRRRWRVTRSSRLVGGGEGRVGGAERGARRELGEEAGGVDHVLKGLVCRIKASATAQGKVKSRVRS